jgi:hypothetical protein
MPRPLADIEPMIVEEMAAQGAKIVEIAQTFGVHRNTITQRFCAEFVKGRLRLTGSLRAAQIRNAIENDNAIIQIFLGKNYLGQSDKCLREDVMIAMEEAGITYEDLLKLIQNKDKLLEEAEIKKSFTEFMVESGYPAPFPKQIEMWQFGFNEFVTRMLLGARGYGKTDYVTIGGIAYDIYLNPESTSNLIVTKSSERNAAIVGEIEHCLRKNGVALESANTKFLRTPGLHGKDASVSAVTVKAKSFRGRHPKRTIMDDPVTEDDVSDATRKQLKRVYNEVMKLTQDVLIIGQPAHKLDLYGELRGVVKTMEVPWGSIPELDHDLEAQKLAGVDEASISASYHLKIITQGVNPFENINYIDQFPTGDTAVAFIDPAEGGDYTALTILRMHLQGIAVVGFCWKRAWNHCLDDMVKHLVKYKVQKLCFETNTTGDQPLDMLRSLFRGIGVIGARSNTNKHSRIMNAGAYAHRIHLSKESDKIYRDQVVNYDETADHHSN